MSIVTLWKISDREKTKPFTATVKTKGGQEEINFFTYTITARAISNASETELHNHPKASTLVPVGSFGQGEFIDIGFNDNLPRTNGNCRPDFAKIILGLT